jgi:hypothetical protein
MYALTDFSDAEKIATIMSIRKSGAFGKYVSIGNGWARVELVNDQDATYMCVLVKSDRAGWTVSFCGIEFVDADLELAAGMAAEWQKAHKGQAIATKNVSIRSKPARKPRLAKVSATLAKMAGLTQPAGKRKARRQTKKS